MKKIIWHVVPMLFILSACPIEKATAVEAKVELTQGVRRDHLKWRVSGKHGGEHAESKTDLRSRRIYLTGLRASILAGNYIGSLDLAYGDVNHGKFREHIRSEEGQRRELANLHAKIRDDYTFDSSVKIGRIFHVFKDATITPSIGYAFFLQRYKMRHGELTVPGAHPNYPGAPHFEDTYEKVHGMHASCKAKWLSPFINLRFSKTLLPSLNLDIGYSFFYPMHYTNKSHFDHLHKSIKDKSRERNTYGQLGDITLRWACMNNLELGLGTVFSEFRGKGGSSRGAGSESFHLKRVRRTTVDYLLSLSYSF